MATGHDWLAWEDEMKDLSDQDWPDYSKPDEHVAREQKVRRAYQGNRRPRSE